MRKPATCTLCEAACGILVDTEGDRVVGVRGDPDDPQSRGYVCPKVVGMQDLHEDPDRLRRPLLRRGEDFVETTWQEALDFAAEGILRVRRAHGPDAVAVYQGNPTAHNLGLLTAGQAVLRKLGTRNLFSASSTDQVPHMRAAHEMFGHVLLMPVPDVDRTDHWLVLGANPVVSNGSIMTAPDQRRRIKELQARGGKLVVVDPRRTETAELADTHVFIRPSTDALLLFAMLYVVFAEGLERPGPHLAGLDELRRLARDFAPDQVASATGVASDRIATMAREFARAERAACYVRVGTCHQEHGTLVSWLAYALNAVTGNLDRAGGAMWTTPAAELMVIADLFGLSSVGGAHSRVRGLPAVGGELPVAVLAEEIETPGQGQIRALITSAGNPVLSAPNGRRIEAALAELDHMVAVDSFLNETTRHAHVILPPVSPLQRAHYDLALNAFGVRNHAKWVDAPLPKGPDELDDFEIFVKLGARILPGISAAGPLQMPVSALLRKLGPEAVVDLALRAGPYGTFRGGLSLAELRKSPHGLDLGPLRSRLPDLLRTPDRKVQLAPQALVAEVPALRALLAPRGDTLTMIGRRHLRSNNSWLHNSTRLVKGRDRCTLLVNPTDARARGIADGALVAVKNARGEVRLRAEVSEEMMPGVVSMPHGFGHHRPGTRMAVAEAHAGVSANDLTDDMLLDRLSGNAAFSGVTVEVSAVVERSEDAHAE
ncbi:MAG: molybdopterin-dependent oxidoreductase [Myxococcales bacterium]|nr:molybdopterin-dependent oxidoreductase [Myxococcales bacterium]